MNKQAYESLYVYIFRSFGYTYASDLSWSLSDICQFYICLFNLICFVWVTCNRKNFWILFKCCIYVEFMYVKNLHVELSSFVTHVDIYLRSALCHVWYYFCTLLTNHYESLLISQLTLLVSSVKSQNCFYVDLHNAASHLKVKTNPWKHIRKTTKAQISEPFLLALILF